MPSSPFRLVVVCCVFTALLSEAVPACYKGCDCLPDMKFVNCSGGNMVNAVGSFAYNTEYLDLSGNLLTGLAPNSLGALWSLRVLLLRDNNITSVADGAFIKLQSLRRLDLSGNRVLALGEGFFLGLDSLLELLLAHNSIRVLEGRTFRNLDSLVRLDLSANRIDAVRPGALSGMTALRRLHLDGNRLATLSTEVFSTLHALEVLGLRGNCLGDSEPVLGVFAPLSKLALLDLAFNRLSGLRFKTLLSIPSSSVHVLLEGNPWRCDCDLQRVFVKLTGVERLFLDDYDALRCGEPAELRGRRVTAVRDELCVGETVTVLVLTVTVLVTVAAAVIMGEKRKRSRAKCYAEESVGLEAYCDN